MAWGSWPWPVATNAASQALPIIGPPWNLPTGIQCVRHICGSPRILAYFRVADAEYRTRFEASCPGSDSAASTKTSTLPNALATLARPSAAVPGTNRIRAPVVWNIRWAIRKLTPRSLPSGRASNRSIPVNSISRAGRNWLASQIIRSERWQVPIPTSTILHGLR